MKRLLRIVESLPVSGMLICWFFGFFGCIVSPIILTVVITLVVTAMEEKSAGLFWAWLFIEHLIWSPYIIYYVANL